jgi:hypothetical protein
MRKILFLIIVCFSVYFITGCDKGIEPEPEKTNPIGQTGFSGKIMFAGTWPSGITRTHLFVFKNPIISNQDFSYANLSFVTDPIPYGSAEFDINSIDQNYISKNYLPGFDITPGDHSYVIVAQSKTAEISFARADWTIVGIYNIGGDQTKPNILTIQGGQITPGVNIIVDFNNPPPQPPM